MTYDLIVVGHFSFSYINRIFPSQTLKKLVPLVILIIQVLPELDQNRCRCMQLGWVFKQWRIRVVDHRDHPGSCT